MNSLCSGRDENDKAVINNKQAKRAPQRIVVKIGSSSLTYANGELNKEKIAFFVAEIVTLLTAGYQVLLVTSGSIAAGFKHIGYPERPQQLKEKQASAAVGQALLMQAYSRNFQRQNYKVGQILLTRANFSNRNQAINAMHTVEELLSRHILPIINENDTVAVDEIRFGDNDTLSALVANLLNAQQLLIFTDTDGLYTADPRKDAAAKKISVVDHIDEEIWKIAGDAGSQVGTGGMRSKLEAARIAIRGGIRVFVGIANETGDLLKAVNDQGKGTYFNANGQKLPIKKQWLGYHSLSNGQIVVDHGAELALRQGGRSLLPAGVISCEGEFHPGDVVEVWNERHQLIGKGIVNYTASQLQAIRGLSSDEVSKRIDLVKVEVIHRDEWVTLLTTS